MFVGEEGDLRQPEEDDDVVGDAELLGSFQRLQKTRQSTAMPRSTARPRLWHGGRGDDEDAAAMALGGEGESETEWGAGGAVDLGGEEASGEGRRGSPRHRGLIPSGTSPASRFDGSKLMFGCGGEQKKTTGEKMGWAWPGGPRPMGAGGLSLVSPFSFSFISNALFFL